MSDHRLDTARRHSLFLARQLDNGKLKPEIFLPMLDKALTDEDFQAFADWDKIRAEESEEELARQLRELRRYVVSQIIVRDINRISDLNEVTRTITLFADFAVNTALDFAYAYYSGYVRHADRALYQIAAAFERGGDGQGGRL